MGRVAPPRELLIVTLPNLPSKVSSLLWICDYSLLFSSLHNWSLYWSYFYSAIDAEVYIGVKKDVSSWFIAHRTTRNHSKFE